MIKNVIAPIIPPSLSHKPTTKATKSSEFAALLASSLPKSSIAHKNHNTPKGENTLQNLGASKDENALQNLGATEEDDTTLQGQLPDTEFNEKIENVVEDAIASLVVQMNSLSALSMVTPTSMTTQVLPIALNIPVNTVQGTMPTDTANVQGAMPTDTVNVQGAMPTDIANVQGAMPTDTANVQGAMLTDTANVQGAMPTDTANVQGAMPTDTANVQGAMPTDTANVQGAMPTDTVNVQGISTGIQQLAQFENATSSIKSNGNTASADNSNIVEEPVKNTAKPLVQPTVLQDMPLIIKPMQSNATGTTYLNTVQDADLAAKVAEQNNTVAANVAGDIKAGILEAKTMHSEQVNPTNAANNQMQSIEQQIKTIEQTIPTVTKEKPIVKDTLEVGSLGVQSANTEVLNAPAKDVNTILPAKQVVEAILQKLDSDAKEFTLQLFPKELGKITIKLISQAGMLTVELLAANPKTQSLILANSGDIRALLQSATDQNRVNVVATPNEQYNQSEQYERQGDGKQQRDEPRKQQHTSTTDFLNFRELIRDIGS